MFYDILKKLCKEKNVSPSRAATECGISRSTVTWWKQHKTSPNSEQISKLANYFGVSIDYLLGKESFRYNPTHELLQLRELLGQDFQLRVITNVTCVCKELSNGYILVVDGRIIDNNKCDVYAEVWNYAHQPFVYDKMFGIKDIKTLRNILDNWEKEYTNLPRLENKPIGQQKEKPAQNVQVRDENDNIVVLDKETRDLIDSLRSKPEMKMLFSVSKGATKEDIIRTVKIIEALKDKKEGD